MIDKFAVFAGKAPDLMGYLIERYGLADFQAAGIAGNLGHESNGFTELHELSQPENRGGYGWCQWTGPRRADFVHFCTIKELDWKSDKANVAYLLHDLDHEYKSSVAAVAKTKTLADATTAFERNYERAGVVAMDSRIHWAQRALAAYKAQQTVQS
jgi:hypothetical protein